MNACKRAMIGNHGETLTPIRPTDREGYALFENWEDHEFELSLVIDFDGWRRELVPMEIKKVELDRHIIANGWRSVSRNIERGNLAIHNPDAIFDDGGLPDIPIREGKVKASWRADRYCRAVGVHVRIHSEDHGLFYCQAAYGPGHNVNGQLVDVVNLRAADPDNGHNEPDILTTNYSLYSHSSAGEIAEAGTYRPCDDFLHGFGAELFF